MNTTKRNQSGSIIPELLMLFAVLFTVATCSISTAKKFDAKIAGMVSNSVELKDSRK